MTSKELETKLRAELSDDIRIYEHKSLAGISNVFWRTEEICPCPTFDVREAHDTSYTFEFPNGMIGIHNSVESVTEKVKNVINFMESEEGKNFVKEEKNPDIKGVFHELDNTPKPLNESNITV